MSKICTPSSTILRNLWFPQQISSNSNTICTCLKTTVMVILRAHAMQGSVQSYYIWNSATSQLQLFWSLRSVGLLGVSVAIHNHLKMTFPASGDIIMSFANAYLFELLILNSAIKWCNWFTTDSIEIGDSFTCSCRILLLKFLMTANSLLSIPRFINSNRSMGVTKSDPPTPITYRF